jgi:hypothetical protein
MNKEPVNESKKAVADRRSFLKGAGAATGGTLLPASAAAEASAPLSTTPALYRETDHIRRYYQLAR